LQLKSVGESPLQKLAAKVGVALLIGKKIGIKQEDFLTCSGFCGTYYLNEQPEMENPVCKNLSEVNQSKKYP